MIDLGVKKSYWQIKLEDKTVLKCKRPTQSLLLAMIRLQGSNEEPAELMEEFTTIVVRIFNRNVNSLEFTKEQIEEMIDLESAVAIMKDYIEFSLSNLKN